jgi:hypothetical protein
MLLGALHVSDSHAGNSNVSHTCAVCWRSASRLSAPVLVHYAYTLQGFGPTPCSMLDGFRSEALKMLSLEVSGVCPEKLVAWPLGTTPFTRLSALHVHHACYRTPLKIIQ